MGKKSTAFLTTLFSIPPTPTPLTTNPSPNTPTITTTARSNSSSRGIPQKLTSLTSKARGEDSRWEWPDLTDAEVQRAIFTSASKKAPPGP